MADITSSENMEEPENPAPADPPEPSEPITEPETILNTPDTETMEVHHHAHHEHGRRSWKSYFWEFLMLFLAVFCGFLAEYMLEHKIESDREKQFIQSLVKDLRTDIQILDSLIPQKTYRMNLGDSLRHALIDKSFTSNGANVYFWARNISRRAFFFSTDGTIQQLKNAGGLRLITKQVIKEKILDYDVRYRSLQSFQSLEEGQLMDYRTDAARLFDAGVFIQIVKPYDTLKTDLPKGNPQLMTQDPIPINEIANKVTYWAQGVRVQIRLLTEMRTKAKDLIELIDKEYHLN